MVSIVQNIQPKPTNVIMGREIRQLFGEDVYEEKLRSNSRSRLARCLFFQSILCKPKCFHQQATRYSDLKGGETSWMCTVSDDELALPRDAKKAHAMEIVNETRLWWPKKWRTKWRTNVYFETGAAEKLCHAGWGRRHPARCDCGEAAEWKRTKTRCA